MSAGSQAPGPLSPIVNFRFFPHGLRYNPFPDRVNLFEIVHLVKVRGRRGSFARTWPDLLGSVFRIRCSQLKPIEFNFEFFDCDVLEAPISMSSSPLSFPGVRDWKVHFCMRSATF